MKRIQPLARHQPSLRALSRPSSSPVASRPRLLLLLQQPRCPPPQTAAAAAPARRWYSAAPEPATTSAPLKKTPLHDLHLAHGGKMVPFGGFHMPVQYAQLSVSASHAHTRARASLFDVSHMVQRAFGGPRAAAFLQRVTPSDLAALPRGRSTLSVLLHPGTGGIVDDTIIARLGDDRFYVVTNAACRDKDDAFLAAELARFEGREGVSHEKLDERGLVALQGPLSAEILAPFVVGPEVELESLYFGSCSPAKIQLPGSQEEHSVIISRGGYTGEDGFEISVDGGVLAAFTEALLASAGPEKLQLAGLGARDSLRLEAGMCLYGHDLDDTTTPVEGGLSWVIPKERRSADAGFHGADVIAKQLVPKSKGGSGVERRRVGFVVEGAPAREGAEIVSKEGEKIGRITSGCPSPTLGKNIAMGYIKDGFHKSGTEVAVVVRGRNRSAIVTKMPFIQTKYWKGIAPA